MPSEDQVVSVVGIAVGILSATLPGPAGAILKAAEPYLGDLVKLIDSLRAGADPDELRRAVGPNVGEVFTELLGPGAAPPEAA